MNLLLLLSALLSALSGVTGGARTAAVPQAVSRIAISASPAAVAAARHTTRPVQPLATIRVVAFAPIATPASREAPALLTNRRRE